MGPISKYLPWKTTPKLLLDCKNLSTTSEVMETSLSEVTVIYSKLTIGFAMKNYPKMTFRLPKPVHWIKSYGDVFFHVS